MHFIDLLCFYFFQILCDAMSICMRKIRAPKGSERNYVEEKLNECWLRVAIACQKCSREQIIIANRIFVEWCVILYDVAKRISPSVYVVQQYVNIYIYSLKEKYSRGQCCFNILFSNRHWNALHYTKINK